MLPRWRVCERRFKEVNKDAYAITEMPSTLINSNYRIFVVALMFGKELYQPTLGEVIGYLHFD